MKKPTGKLAHAYNTFHNMEAIIERQKAWKADAPCDACRAMEALTQTDPIAVGRSALARWELAMTRSLGEYPVPLLAERSVKEMRAFLGVQTQRELLKNSQQFPSPTGCPGPQAQPTREGETP